MDAKRELLRHIVATIAYRGGKAVRGAPPSFAAFAAGDTTRTPERILAHIGDLFDWQAVPSPCGDAYCSVMPGGGAIVAFNSTKHPEEVGKLVAYMAQPEVIGEVLARTADIPQNATLVQNGVNYVNLDETQAAGLQLFTAQIPKISPAAYRLQGSKYMIAYINAFAARLSQAINGELTVDEALQRVMDDVNLAIDSAGK